MPRISTGAAGSIGLSSEIIVAMQLHPDGSPRGLMEVQFRLQQ